MSLGQVVLLMFTSVSSLHPNDPKVVITSPSFANEKTRSEKLLLWLESHTINRLGCWTVFDLGLYLVTFVRSIPPLGSQDQEISQHFSWEMGILHMPRRPGRPRCVDLWVPGQPGLQSEFQAFREAQWDHYLKKRNSLWIKQESARRNQRV